MSSRRRRLQSEPQAGLFGGNASGSQASSSSSRPPPPYDANGVATFSFAHLQRLYDRLSQFRPADLDKGGGDVVETVRQITEALIWGEQNDAHFFDFFCEKSILSDFVRVLGLAKAPKVVKVQLLQSLSMLVSNITQRTSVYYLLSNNHVNRLIQTSLDFEDEDILAHYITLMKSLAMRLDLETIKFFFIQQPGTPGPTFPLYTEATKFFSHRDQMVRATVRTITLQVYGVEDEDMRRFVLRHAAEDYFTRLACHLRDLWLRLGTAAAAACERDLAAVRSHNELQQDMQIYLSDVFELGVVELNEILADRILNYAALPGLLAGVAALEHRGGGDEAREPEGGNVLTPAVALFLLRQVLETFRCTILLDTLVSALLHPAVPAALAYAIPGGELLGLPEGADLQDGVPNRLRECFLLACRDGPEVVRLLCAAVAHACVANRRSLSPQCLGLATILPHGEPTDASSQEEGAELGLPEVLGHVLQFLRAGGSELRPDVLRVHICILLDIFLDPVVARSGVCCDAVIRAVRSALQRASHRLRDSLRASAAGGATRGDPALDAVLAAWVSHEAPLEAAALYCADPRRLLAGGGDAPTRFAPPPPGGGTRRPEPDGASGGAAAGSGAVAAEARLFFHLRRLLAALVRELPAAAAAEADEAAVEQTGQSASRRAWASAGEDTIPLQLEDVEGTGAALPAEGSVLELGASARLVCGVASAAGKRTRYLLLHDAFLLLAQPDPARVGQATVRTAWPIWQVDSAIDRSDPRSLHLAVHARRGQGAPGEAAAAGSSGHFGIVLNFEDATKCCEAQGHLSRRRWALRSLLLQQAVALADSFCGAASPAAEAAPEHAAYPDGGAGHWRAPPDVGGRGAPAEAGAWVAPAEVSACAAEG